MVIKVVQQLLKMVAQLLLKIFSITSLTNILETSGNVKYIDKIKN